MASGSVAFYQDANFRGQRTDIVLSDYVAGQRHVMPAQQYDNAACVVWNLPLGTVMTVQAAIKYNQGADLKDCGYTVDLVGYGFTRTCDLSWEVQMDNQASMFFWRNVDHTMGAIELFTNPDFKGRRVTLFLSEWAPGRVHR